jgi:hypothetical protein
MEFSDGKTILTHIAAALSISDQQEADKLLSGWATPFLAMSALFLSFTIRPLKFVPCQNCPVCPEEGF